MSTPISGSPIPPQIPSVPSGGGGPITQQSNILPDPPFDPLTADLLDVKLDANAFAAITPPNEQSALAFRQAISNAQLEQNAQLNAQGTANPYYYKFFGIGLDQFVASMVFLTSNLGNFVTKNNQLNADQSVQFPVIAPDVLAMQTSINNTIPNLVNTINQATTDFQHGTITQGQYNQAINNYNNQINNINGQIQTFNSKVGPYDQQAQQNNSTIQFLNNYMSKWSPPSSYQSQPIYQTLPLAPTFSGGIITFAPPPAPASLPLIVPLVDENTVANQQISPLQDQLNTILAQLEMSQQNIAYISGLQKFGLLNRVPDVTQITGSTGSASSSASFATVTADPNKPSNQVASKLTQKTLDTQTQRLGIPSGSPLQPSVNLLLSETYRRTGQFSTSEALRILGLQVTPDGIVPVSVADQDATALAPGAGASPQAGATFQSTETPSPTASQLTSASNLAAALGVISTINTLITSGTLQDRVTAIVLNDPASSQLTPEQKQSLITSLTAALTLQFQLQALVGLSVALGTPGLLPQFLANVAGYTTDYGKSFLNNEPPFQGLANAPATQIFVERQVSDTLQSELGLTQKQADAIASDALQKTLSDTSITDAQTMQAALQANINTSLIQQGVAQSDADRASIQAIDDVNNDVQFSATQNAVILEDQVKTDIQDGLTQAGLNADDVARASNRAIADNRDLIKNVTLASDDQSRQVAVDNLNNGILQSLTKSGIENQTAIRATDRAIALLHINDPAKNPLKAPSAAEIASTDALSTNLNNLIVSHLQDVTGLTQAQAVADQYTSTLITSPNSYLNVASDAFHRHQDTLATQQDQEYFDNFRDFVSDPTKGYVQADNLMDPGKKITHNALTGIMSAMPQPIKNTDPVQLMG